MNRRAALVVVLATLAAACSTSIDDDAAPDCALDNGSAVLLAAQAVPTAELIPCIAGLEPGWTLGSIEAERGSARFTLDSDAIGDGFLAVDLAESCPILGDESLHVVPGGNTWLSQDVVETRPAQLGVALIPVAGRQVVYANALALELGAVEVDAEVVPVGATRRARVAEARAAGRYAVVIDDFGITEDTVFLYSPASAQEQPADRDDIVDLLVELKPEAGRHAYQGTWQFRFHGGCVTYRFDASGPEASALPEQVTGAVSFVARTTLDRFTRVNVGQRLDP